ncbi:hypothetical protein Halru_2001 [Halovivax ruber XH-70]|uniref:Uncharacterized protein n=1 Tax=Halovivax ruber (strain DSM 18193 / JCM 13892 / XH-70) TaxID=797302 RepID=L0IAH1_HALRX|nr:hypothetical protein [Halovivax ruber]AGB16595.1 hypothetical protein Halru_2001 [Halovivax ruber XH-70]
MTGNLGTYFETLTMSDRADLETRLERYRDQLADQGYEATIAEGEDGFFAGVLVIDDDGGRFGFLEPDGSISWIGGENGGIGALGTAVAQNPTEELEPETDGLDNVDVK